VDKLEITYGFLHKKHDLPTVFHIADTVESAHTFVVRKMSSGFSSVYRWERSRGGSTGTSGPMPNPRRLLNVSVSFSEVIFSVCSLPRDTDAVFDGDGVSLVDSMRKHVRNWVQRTLADLCPGCAFDRCMYTASFVRTEPGRLQEALGVLNQRYTVVVSQDYCP